MKGGCYGGEDKAAMEQLVGRFQHEVLRLSLTLDQRGSSECLERNNSH